MLCIHSLQCMYWMKEYPSVFLICGNLFNMKSFFLIILLSALFINGVLAQEKKDTIDRYQSMETRYQKLKDSFRISNPFIPAVSSVMIKHRQIELNYFASLASANRYRDIGGNLQDINARQTYLYNTLQITYGISKDVRFNIGLDVNAAMGRIDEDPNSSVFKVFDESVTGNSRHAGAITSFAPRIRWMPFKNNYRFTIQSSVILPMPVNDAKQQVLGHSQIYFLSQFLYNLPLSERLYLFSQLSLQYGFKRANVPAVFYSPLSVYLSYYIPKKLILFGLMNYVPIFTKESKWTYSRYTVQAGGGIQYQVSKQILLNAYYATDLKGKNYPNMGSYTISFRFITL